MTTGFFFESYPILSGVVGYEMNLFISDFIGASGVLVLLVLGLIVFAVRVFNFQPYTLLKKLTSKKRNRTNH
jgi:S-DNA-T family DNA segregation ATPase FtsK/SpoIIIE